MKCRTRLGEETVRYIVAAQERRDSKTAGDSPCVWDTQFLLDQLEDGCRELLVTNFQRTNIKHVNVSSWLSCATKRQQLVRYHSNSYILYTEE